MNTPSHLILSAALRKVLRPQPIPAGAFLLGSVAPDLPLFALTIGGLFYFPLVRGWSLERAANYMFYELFFFDPFWISAHNFLHSPLVLLILLLLLHPFRRRINSPARWFWWFALACMFHTLIDIPTHVDDGPLLLWPINWSLRFEAPISYWDADYFGREFAIFEAGLSLVLLGYLLGPPVLRRLSRRLGGRRLGAE
jgi:hypothetical protein